jgi:hypothetical protein
MNYLEKQDLPAQLRHLHDKGHIRVTLADTVHIPGQAGTWSGGTIDHYSAVELSAGRAVQIDDTFSAPWDASRHSRTVTLRPGYAIARTGSFCGKPAGLHLYCTPQDAAPMLPAPIVLSEDEATVLNVICGLKSGYRADGYRRAGLSDAAVQACRASLERQGMLTASGAVTVKGRNSRSYKAI